MAGRIILRSGQPYVGPLRVSTQNPRYFCHADGVPVFLTGSHTWNNRQNFSGDSFNYTNYLDRLQALGHNFFRLWVWEQAKWVTQGGTPVNASATLTPEIWARTGPGNADDGGLKFDLTQFNQAHFDRIRACCLAAGSRNPRMYCAVMLFDGWSLYLKSLGSNPWPGHPFKLSNNINSVNGDPNTNSNGTECNTLDVSAVTTVQEAYVAKVIDTVNDLDNVLYEICNESDLGSGYSDWQAHFIDYIHAYEASRPKQHPVGWTAIWDSANNNYLFSSEAEWVSPNFQDAYDTAPPANDGTKVVVQDNDHIQGHNSCDRIWAWKSATRGHNVLYMDTWDQECIADAPNLSFRSNLGYINSYMRRLNLALCVPAGALCTTGYCLAYAAASSAQYLAFQPGTGAFDLNVSAFSGTLNVEWFDPENGTSSSGGTISGGATRTLTPPFAGDAVAYVYDPALG